MNARALHEVQWDVGVTIVVHAVATLRHRRVVGDRCKWVTQVCLCLYRYCAVYVKHVIDACHEGDIRHSTWWLHARDGAERQVRDSCGASADERHNTVCESAGAVGGCKPGHEATRVNEYFAVKGGNDEEATRATAVAVGVANIIGDTVVPVVVVCVAVTVAIESVAVAVVVATAASATAAKDEAAAAKGAKGRSQSH